MSRLRIAFAAAIAVGILAAAIVPTPLLAVGSVALLVYLWRTMRRIPVRPAADLGHSIDELAEAVDDLTTEIRSLVPIEGFMWCTAHSDVSDEADDGSRCAAITKRRWIGADWRPDDDDDSLEQPCVLVELYHRTPDLRPPAVRLLDADAQLRQQIDAALEQMKPPTDGRS